MQTPISELLYTHWTSGRKSRTTPSGWISANSVCCVHNGHSSDNRGRGGLNITSDGGVVYSCFNCGFKASWSPGKPLSKKIKKLMKWMGITDDKIKKMSFYALQHKTEINSQQEIFIPKFSVSRLPDKSIPIDLNKTYDDDEINKVVDYARTRNLHTVKGTEFYWSSSPLYRDRLIIPYYYQGKIVGWIARTHRQDKKPKYIADAQPGYVYGIDSQTNNRKICIVCEGVIDAALIEGCAVLSHEIGQKQYEMINALNKQVIVLPDRDKSGKLMVEQALEYNWAVSFPPWDDGVKDAADAVNKYGKLYTVYSIVRHAQYTNLKIQLAAKKWFW